MDSFLCRSHFPPLRLRPQKAMTERQLMTTTVAMTAAVGVTTVSRILYRCTLLSAICCFRRKRWGRRRWRDYFWRRRGSHSVWWGEQCVAYMSHFYSRCVHCHRKRRTPVALLVQLPIPRPSKCVVERPANWTQHTESISRKCRKAPDVPNHHLFDLIRCRCSLDQRRNCQRLRCAFSYYYIISSRLEIK